MAVTANKKQVHSNDCMQSAVQVKLPTKSQCGCCGTYPKRLEIFSNPKTFLLLFSLKNVIQGMLWTYMVGIGTSVERHFQFSSKKVGLLIMLGEIGQVITAVFMAFYGSRGNRPRWMAAGLYTIALSCILSAAMNLVFPPPFISDTDNATIVGTRMCRLSSVPFKFQQSGSEVSALYLSSGVDIVAAENKSAKSVEYSVARSRSVGTASSSRNVSFYVAQNDGDGGQHLWTTPGGRDDGVVVEEAEAACTVAANSNNIAWSAWFVIYSLMGIGATTVYTIGAPYLDDSVAKKDSPLYFAISIAMRIFGPVFGYLLSSAVLKTYVYPRTDPGFLQDDPRWIGAWWLGLLILACLLTVAAVIIAMFPPEMPKNEDSQPEVQLVKQEERGKMEHEEEARKKTVLQFNELKAAISRQFRNVILMCSCISNIFSIIGLAGFFIYLPKYYEHQFRVSKSESSLYTGISGSAPMIFGVLLGGLLMSRYRPRAQTVAFGIASCKYVYVAGLLVLMFVGCHWQDVPGEFKEDGSFVLQDSCNNGCRCGQEEFIPVCFDNGTTQRTFFSPCHAGCSQKHTNGSHIESYTSCRCLPDPALTVKPGYCDTDCSGFYIYAIVLAVVKFIVSTSTIGNLIIDLRCVKPEDKAVALGLLTAMMSLFGFLPVPLMFGALIDSTCLVWEESCDTSGACWLYDTESFRYKLHGLTAAAVMIAGLFEIIIYFKVSDLQLADEEVKKRKEDKVQKNMVESRV